MPVQVVEAKPPQPPQPPPKPAEAVPEVRIVTAGPDRPDAPLLTALRGLMDKRPQEEVLAALDGYEPADRQLLRDVLRVAARLGDRDLTNSRPQEMALALDEMETLLRALRPRAALVLDKLCFVRSRSVDNFGIYEPLEDGHVFRAPAPGHPGEPVQVYAEVRNFASLPVSDCFETVLKVQLTIAGKLIQDGPDQEPVVTFSIKPCIDRSRTPRQDLFVNFHFQTPNVPPGSYTLWVQVEDVTPSPDGARRPPRVARRSLDFRVVGDTPVASR
jgi:hypothetical protein